jgi:predicted ATPase
LRASTTPLVGRDEEIDLLLRRWQQAKAGDGCVVLITGEPGIGKSRIAQTILERLSKEHLTRLRYFCSFCSPQHQDSALYPVITQLEHAARFRRDDSIEQRLDKLEAVLARDARDLNEALRLYAALLSIPTGERYPPLNISPQEQKQRTLDVMLEMVEGLAARQPLLMVSEDVQWIDPTSLELLDLIIDRVPALPVLLVVTFRPEFVPRWVGRSHVTLLSLSRLPPPQRAEMITGVAAGKTLPKEVGDEIIARTDGIPLFIEELTKAVLESGVLTDAGDRFTMTRPMPRLAIPASLIALLLARLDRSTLMRQVAQIGAALGRRFSHELISTVATMPQQNLDDALAQLVDAELIFRRGTPPEAEYTFKHALVQDAAYGTLLRSQRRQLHARVAATLEDQFPEIVVAQPALLAQHCAEAGLAEKAVGYWLKASRQARARSAMKEAVAQLQKGLEVLASLPESPWRRQKELDLQIALRRVLAATKGYAAPDVGESIARARKLAEQIDRPEYLVPLLHGQWEFHTARSEHKLALPFAEQIEKIGEARNDVVGQLLGRYLNGYTRLLLGQLVAARALLEQCTGGDPRILGHLAVTLAYLGYIDQARSRLNEAFRETRRLKNPHKLGFVLLNGYWIASIACSPEVMKRHAEELLAVSTEHAAAETGLVGRGAHRGRDGPPSRLRQLQGQSWKIS